MKTILVDAFNTLILENEGVFEDIYKLLEEYPNPKIVVTNANDEQMVKLGIDKSPYEIFTLKHNPDKPNPTYFKTLLEKYNLNPKNIIYFEHNKDAVETARSIGINTYHYNHNEKNITTLKEFLDENI